MIIFARILRKFSILCFGLKTRLISECLRNRCDNNYIGWRSKLLICGLFDSGLFRDFTPGKCIVNARMTALRFKFEVGMRLYHFTRILKSTLELGNQLAALSIIKTIDRS